MSRPESQYVTDLRTFRDRLVEARRAIAREAGAEAVMRRFIEVETAISLVDRAIENELDMTPIPHVDDPTQPPPFPDSDQGPPLIKEL